MMMADNPKIIVETKAEGVKKTSDDLKSLGNAGKQAEREMSSLAETMKKLKTAVVAYLSIDMGKRVLEQADSFRRLEQRLTLITKNQDEYNNSLKSVLKTSNSLGVNLKDSSAIFQRFNIELSRMGKGNQEVIKFYETTLALGSVGASSVDSMNDALIQLGQSLTGRVQADEFRSISEQAPLIAIALKEYLKVSSSELKEMFKNGEVYSKDLYDAIMSRGKDVEKIYANLPISVERGFIGLQNTFMQTFAELDKQAGISVTIINGLNGVSKVLQWVGQNLDTVKTITVLTTAAVASLALALNMTAIITGVTKALTAMSVALTTTRLGVIAMNIAINPLYGTLTLLATTGVVLFTNNMIKGFSATREAVYKSTGGMISDIDVLMSKMVGLSAYVKAMTSSKKTKGNLVKGLGYGGIIGGSIGGLVGGPLGALGGLAIGGGVGATAGALLSDQTDANKARSKAEQAYLNSAGKRAAASEMLRGLALGTGETPSFEGETKNKKKGKSEKSEAQKEAERYADALKGLKEKARDAMLEVQGMDKAIQALSTGGIKAYEAQLKQNEGLGRYNELMGDYLGKGKRELELLAQSIVKREQDTEAKKKQLELSVSLKEAMNAVNIEEGKQKALRDAFLAGGEKALELKQREIDIEQRKRDLLKDSNATDEQKKQAEDIAKKEDAVARNKTILEKQVADAREASDAIRSALSTAFDNTITYMVNGTSSFKDIMVGLLRQIAVQLIKVYALQLLTGIVTSVTGGFLKGGAVGAGHAGAGGAVGGGMDGHRAGGGSVSPNRPYMVGESGREMFVPRSAGNIIPSHAMPSGGGGGGITVINNVTVNTQGGGKGDNQGLAEAGKAISEMIEMKVRQVLKTESRQGGMLQRGFA